MLGDATGIISELSLTRALTKYNGILAAAGATCDCAAAHEASRSSAPRPGTQLPPQRHPGGQGVVCVANRGDQECMCPGCKTVPDGEEVLPTFGVLQHHHHNQQRSRGRLGEGSAQPLFE